MSSKFLTESTGEKIVKIGQSTIAYFFGPHFVKQSSWLVENIKRILHPCDAEHTERRVGLHDMRRICRSDVLSRRAIQRRASVTTIRHFFSSSNGRQELSFVVVRHVPTTASCSGPTHRAAHSFSVTSKQLNLFAAVDHADRRRNRGWKT